MIMSEFNQAEYEDCETNTREEQSDSLPSTTIENRVMFVHVNLYNGKRWLVTDPDSEEDPAYSKDLRDAFEFKDFAHAQRARDMLSIMDIENHIFGDLYTK